MNVVDWFRRNRLELEAAACIAALFAVGMDVANLDTRPDRSQVRDDEPAPRWPDPDIDEDPDVHRRRSLDREPALTG